MAKKKYDIKPASRSEVALLVAMMDATTKSWKDDLRGISEKEFRWQAKKGAHSIAMMILHCVMAEYWWIQSVTLGKDMDMKFINGLGYKRMDIANGIYGTPLKKPKAWYLKQMTDIRRKTKKAMKGLKPSHTGIGRGNEFTLRWVLHHLVEHEAYHSGQMTLLRELYRKRRSK
ncbi:MAG: DUF664 domain-containing protein [Armatimonadetes bacterium]|nr:DUF664 domain-containing protein [Armatimonadota bacterium]